MSLQSLAGGFPEVRISGNRAQTISGMEYNSALIGPGDLFVAIPGGRHDGHDYVRQAIENGAAAVMVEHTVTDAVPEIIVPDTRAILPEIAAGFFGYPSRELTAIGITGTDGKTTTSHIVDWILRSAGFRTGMVGTVSVRIGDDVVDHETRQTTPESLDIQRYLRQMVDSGTDFAILEATSHGLDLHRLDEVRFAVGAVTNITHEHLEHHKTIEAYRRAKGILFERVGDENGISVINIDDEGAREMLTFASFSTTVTYSMRDDNVEYFATNIDLQNWGSRFDVVEDDGVTQFELPMVGDFNVMNALCAIALTRELGVPAESIAEALAKAPPVPGRMASVDEGQPFRVIVDYAHTPESLTKVLTLLRSVNPDGRIICVSGSAGDRDRTKRPLQGEVCARLADISIFTSEDPRFENARAIIDEIASGALERGGVNGETFFKITDRRDAIRHALSLARPGDCLLLAGKGHERSILWEDRKIPWDEAAVAKELLHDLGYGAND